MRPGPCRVGSAEAESLEFSQAKPSTEPLPGVRLTSREAEVATYLARGLSNKEIATALTISIRTAEGHVEQVLRKLGANTRAQAAAMIVSGQAPDDPSTQTQAKLPSSNSARR